MIYSLKNVFKKYNLPTFWFLTLKYYYYLLLSKLKLKTYTIINSD